MIVYSSKTNAGCDMESGPVSKHNIIYRRLELFVLVPIHYFLADLKYCCVPARWGLHRTALAPGRDEIRAVTLSICK